MSGIFKFAAYRALPAIALCVWCASGVFAGELRMISGEQLHAKTSGSGKTLIVDVRGAYDFEKGHIPGAQNASYDKIDKAGLPKDRELALYCGNEQCPLSHLAARTLEKAGYKNVKVLSGGIDEWAKKGFKIESGGQVMQAKSVVKPGAMSASTLKKRIKNGGPVIIDTRPEKEFPAGHIPGARNMPLENLKTLMTALTKDREIVVYDRQNDRAVDAIKLLTAAGFQVYELSGGLQVWSAKKYPLYTGILK